jgi:predicted dinucleotide-binding enzyme
MRIGILGSGLMGGKLGTIFAKAGHHVVFSYARRSRPLAPSRAKSCSMSSRPNDVARVGETIEEIEQQSVTGITAGLP